FYYPASHRHLPSFPTRRSSDLDKTPGAEPDPRPLQRKRPFRDVTSIGAFPASDSDPCTRERRCEWFIRTKSIGLPVSVTVRIARSEEHTSELQSRVDLVCRLLL